MSPFSKTCALSLFASSCLLTACFATTTTSEAEMPATPTFEDDEAVASIINEECEYNTFMCCWTMNDGEGMADNTDVCYVNDYYSSSTSNTTLEFPADSEGEVHCHGFAWEDGADYLTQILPLYSHVYNFDHVNYRGYYGNIEGGPECACIEEMPVVTRADCTTIKRADGLSACVGNDLRRHYHNVLGAPMGDIDFNLVQTCDNEDDPVSVTFSYEERETTDSGDDENAAVEAVLDTCDYNLYMCCWTEGVEDNTDVCYVNDYPEEGEIVEFPGDVEGDVYCHGFGWKVGDDFLAIQLPQYHYVTNLDYHMGYSGSIEGGLKCGCIEDMPIVSTSACTTLEGGTLAECSDNNLWYHHRGRLQDPGGELQDAGYLPRDGCENASNSTSDDM